ncbi:MAG TPA: zinc-binding dehydrogenase [Vicinamibacterales bacterium]|nr:zinc-binding dehydrogenase [Vicinamibacterales bacterium]
MKAVRFHEHGGPDVLTLEDAPDPGPRPGHAVVRVRACALNHLDIWQRRGIERVTIPFPHISGADAAGEVVGTGERVMLQPGLSCGTCAACLAGRDNRCARYDVLGYQSDGGYAQYVRVFEANLIPIPPHIDFVEAAAFPLTFLTAWHMLFSGARLEEGDVVLVLAAGSGVGQAALQLARHAGAFVIATAGSDDKLALAATLGADATINHAAEDVAAAVRRITSGRGADIVVEHVGKATWDASVRSLAKGGRLVTCGATTGHEASVDLRHLFGRQLSLVGSYMGEKAELLEAARLFFGGIVRPVIDRVFPLAEAAAAHRYLEERRQFGKVVLEV